MIACYTEAAAEAFPRHSISLVIPAYNESARVGSTLDSTVAFLRSWGAAFEVLLVDDGSDDGTAAIARNRADALPELRVISIEHGGKAAALRAGLIAAENEIVGFSDADLATPLTYLEELADVIAAGSDVAIGSREGAGSRRVGEPVIRHVMGRVFNLIVQTLLLPGLQDTQCGFKLFRREAIQSILARTKLYADGAQVRGPRVTAFDVELLVIAQRLGFKITPVSVVWTYGAQSKVQPGFDTWHNLRDVLKVRFNVWRGTYT